MSQQINLLDRPREPVGSALGGLAVVAVVLLGLVSYEAELVVETNRLRKAADAGQRDLTQVNAAMQAMRQRADADNDATAIKAEIDALKPKAEAVQQLLEPIRNGSLGSTEGYARYLSTLASVSEEGLWLTNVSITNAGKVMTLNGRALRNESVLKYAKRLNEAFASYGVQFNSVEMTPENLTQTGAMGKPVLTTVSFRLF